MIGSAAIIGFSDRVPVPDSHHVRSYLVVPRTQAAAFTRELGSLMRTESTKGFDDARYSRANGPTGYVVRWPRT